MTQPPLTPADSASALRRGLDRFYLAGGAIGAAFIAAIVAVVLVQVFCNIANSVALSFSDTPLGWSIPDYAEIAGYFLVAASFFSAAYTLRSGGHIRVTLILQRLGPRARLLTELLCCGLGAAMGAYFTYWSGMLVWESWFYGDLSRGLLPIPIWIPQTPIPLGLGLLTLALADQFLETAATAKVREAQPGDLSADGG